LYANFTFSIFFIFFFSSRRRHTRSKRDWSSDVCSSDLDKLLKLFDRMISSKVDGIIVQGIQGERFVELVHKAVEREIPIITVDTDVPNSERKAYVGTNNFRVGKLAGKKLIESTTGNQYVGFVTGGFNAINKKQQLKDLKEPIKKFSGIN